LFDIINILLILASSLLLVFEAVLLWKTYRKYPYSSFFGYMVSSVLIIIGFLSALPLHLAPPLLDTLEITEDIERAGMCLILIAIVLSVYSVILFSSIDTKSLEFGLFIFISVVSGITIGFIISGGIKHTIGLNNIKIVEYTNDFILSMLILVFGLTFLLIRLFLKAFRSQSPQTKKSDQEIDQNRLKSLLYILFIPLMLLFFVVFLFLISNTGFGSLIPLQGRKAVGILFFIYYISKIVKHPETLFLSDVRLHSFLVIARSGVPLYVYETSSSQTDVIKADIFNIPAVLSAVQIFLRATLGETAHLKYLYSENGIISIYLDPSFQCLFCLITDKMSPIISETIQALRIRFLRFFTNDIRAFLATNVPNQNQYRKFDETMVDFARFFI
ncbi:MAG: hypothetical protein ACFFBD_28485, partial [Candidatus Hodarchaeota archaeon]